MMEHLKGLGVRILVIRGTWIVLFVSILFSSTGCNEQQRRLEENQLVLEEKIDSNARRIAILAAHYQKSQDRLNEKISAMHRSHEISLAEAVATRYEQRMMREDNYKFDQKWHAGMTRMEEKQHTLAGVVSGVDQRALKINNTVSGMSEVQLTMQGQLVDDQKQVADSLRRMTSNQDDIYAKTTEGVTIGEGISQGVRVVRAQQKGLREDMLAADKKLSDQVGGVTRRQVVVQSSLDRNETAVDGIAAGLSQAQDKQIALSSMIQDHDRNLKTSAAEISKGQDVAQNSLNRHQETVNEITADASLIQKNQTAMSTLIQTHDQTLRDLASQITKSQTVAQNALDRHQRTANGIAADVSQVQKNQADMSTTIRAHDQAHKESTAGIMKGQQVAQAARWRHQTTVDAIAADTSRIQQNQADMSSLIQTQDQTLATFASENAKGQQVAQNAMGHHQATVDGVVASVSQVQENQAEMSGLIQAHDQTLKTSASERAKGQQVAQAARWRHQTTVDAIAADTSQIKKNQAEISSLIQAHEHTLKTSASEITKGQQVVQDSLDRHQTAVKGIATDVSRLYKNQTDMSGVIRAHDQTLKKSASEIANGQKSTLNTMNRHLAAVNGIAAGVSQVQTDQADTSTTLRAHNRRMEKAVVGLAEGQSRLTQRVQSHRDLSDSVATGINAIQANQRRTDQAISANQTALVSKLDTITKAHEENGAHLKALRTMGDRVVVDTTDIMQQNTSFHELITKYNASINKMNTRRTVKQDLMQKTLSQIYGDTQGLTTSSAMLIAQHTAMQQTDKDSHEAVKKAFASLGTDTQQMSASLEAYQAASQQIRTDIKNILSQQASLKQLLASVQAAAEASSGKTDAIAKQQDLTAKLIQYRTGKIDTTVAAIKTKNDALHKGQTQVSQAMAKNNAAINKALAGLGGKQTTFQGEVVALNAKVTGLEKTIKALDDLHQTPSQTETRILADLKTFSLTLEQIKGTQVELTAQLEQVRGDAERYSKVVMSALDDMKKNTDDAAAQQPKDKMQPGVGTNE